MNSFENGSYNSTAEQIVNWLFETSAVRVADPDQPFWYTSGTLGPYYINTHFLYGNQNIAEELLETIEMGVEEPLELPSLLARKTIQQYQENEIYHGLIELIIKRLENENFDYISGGERRDFFFSIPVAVLMSKPHLTILKDGRTLISDKRLADTQWTQTDYLTGKKVLHIADLVTEASSYIRAWIPAINQLNGTIDTTLAVVDRCQGGKQILAVEGIELMSMTAINNDLFVLAVRQGLLSDAQQQMIAEFTNDPHKYMQNFLLTHPDFLSQQLALGGKSAERAQLCLEQGYGSL